MFDYAVVPPEITSALVYTGPGSQSLVAAASAWDALAAQLDSYARGYSSVIAGLQGEGWAGPASAAMAAAAAPYAAWATTTGAHAEHAASQARAAAAAYETAHAAVVPPPVVTANRIQLQHLIQTNLLGQNAPTIAATEANYAQMWAQDTAAMHGYTASAASAVQVTPFTAPPQTTNPAGQSAQAAAVAASTSGSSSATQTALAQFIEDLSLLFSGGGPNPGLPNLADGIPIPNSLLTDYGAMGNIFNGFDTLTTLQIRNVSTNFEFGVVMTKLFTDGLLFQGGAGLAGTTSPGAVATPTTLADSRVAAGASRTVLASVGTAATVGPLSAPAAWAGSTPVASANVQWLSSGTTWDAAPKMHAAGTGQVGAMAPMAGVAAAAAARKIKPPSISTILQVTPPRFKMPRPSSGG